jgi:hypothetical protein
MIYFVYPKTEAVINGNFVSFNSINANVIIISENPDFSNPKYLDLTERKNLSFNLEPGKYYWKADNSFIEGLKNEFIIESEIGLIINRSDNEADLVNVGNVRINVTRDNKGVMVGHIILEPDEAEKIEDSGKYIGGQDG